MFAVIHQVPHVASQGMLSLAGRPLIGRQLDWLRAIGCEFIVVEIGEDAGGRAVAKWLGEHEARVTDVILVRSDRAYGPRDAARRGGVSSSSPFLAVPADLLGDGDLRAMLTLGNAAGVIACFEAPMALGGRVGGGTIRLVRAPLGGRQPTVVGGPGWAVRLQSEADARRFSEAVLAGVVVPRVPACPAAKVA